MSVRHVDSISFHLIVRSVTRILEIARHALPFGSVMATSDLAAFEIYRATRSRGSHQVSTCTRGIFAIRGLSRVHAYPILPSESDTRLLSMTLAAHFASRLPRRREATRMSGRDGASAVTQARGRRWRNIGWSSASCVRRLAGRSACRHAHTTHMHADIWVERPVKREEKRKADVKILGIFPLVFCSRGDIQSVNKKIESYMQSNTK